MGLKNGLNSGGKRETKDKGKDSGYVTRWERWYNSLRQQIQGKEGV